MQINTVISGEYEGKKVIDGFGNHVFIQTSTFGSKTIDKKTTNTIEIISEDKNEKSDIAYRIKILFVSGKESIICVDKKIYNKLIEFWPEKKKDRLRELLSQGYKIVGYTSYFLGSAFGTSTVFGQSLARMQRQHNILLQKDINLEIVTIIEESIDGKMIEKQRQTLVVSPINYSE